MDDLELQNLYVWLDEIPLSRPKKSITRDFSDGGICLESICKPLVLLAEVVHHFFPRLVELHNYPPASSGAQKAANWDTLNRKGFISLLSARTSVLEAYSSRSGKCHQGSH